MGPIKWQLVGSNFKNDRSGSLALAPRRTIQHDYEFIASIIPRTTAVNVITTRRVRNENRMRACQRQTMDAAKYNEARYGTTVTSYVMGTANDSAALAPMTTERMSTDRCDSPQRRRQNASEGGRVSDAILS